MPSLWNAKSRDPLTEAQNSGATVTMTCCLVRKGEPVEMRIEGLLRNVQGREAQLFVTHATPLPGKSKTLDGRFDFTFQIAARSADAQGARMGASGTGLILKTEDDKDGTLRTVDVRFPLNYNVRPLRRNKRYFWKDEFTRLFCVMQLDRPPATREELAALLRSRPEASSSTQLIDISAGGACACLSEDAARPSFSSGVIYLVFLIPSRAAREDSPFVFLARRLGLGREQCPQGISVRLCFTDELSWAHQQQTLKWLPIELDGSSRLRACLEQHYDAECGTAPGD